jgi:hypothetical protein
MEVSDNTSKIEERNPIDNAQENIPKGNATHEISLLERIVIIQQQNPLIRVLWQVLLYVNRRRTSIYLQLSI